MTLVNKISFESLIMIGDLHTKWQVIIDFILKYEIKNACFFQVGDFGIGLYPKTDLERLEELNNILKANNNVLYVIRGNHDNPELFQHRSRFNPIHDFGNINFIPDYIIVEIILNNEQKNIFCAGGAISVDRTNSVEGIDYWKDEKFVLQFPENVNNYGKIDVIVTHTAPEFVAPYYNKSQIIGEYAKKDVTLKDEVFQERRDMSYLIEKLIEVNPNLKYAFYGHFHSNEITEYKSVIFEMLAINQFKIVNL